MKKNIKICAISDTHNLHKGIKIPKCDILIHCGDMTGRGTDPELNNFFNWFAEQDKAEYKVCIAGNHDYGCQKRGWQNPRKDKVIYLQDNGVELFGIKIWGTPWTPYFHDWAFNGLPNNLYYPGGPGSKAKPNDMHPLLEKVYETIPDDTNVLLCHGPIYSILDNTPIGLNVGSKELQKKVSKLELNYFFHGHIHYARGYKNYLGIHCYNVASLDEDYNLYSNPITTIEI